MGDLRNTMVSASAALVFEMIAHRAILHSSSLLNRTQLDSHQMPAGQPLIKQIVGKR